MFERFPVQDFQDTYLGTLTAGSGSYPASRIQKGLVLGLKDRDLSEEGVGFGVPVLKFGLESIFPGSWRMSAKKHRWIFLNQSGFQDEPSGTDGQEEQYYQQSHILLGSGDVFKDPQRGSWVSGRNVIFIWHSEENARFGGHFLRDTNSRIR